ncbi:hypothetical protein ASJ34_08480 [Xanthomonas campestris pv. campestris]|nr:hypothetical protein ASJ34_08480 [Xanthomonas campestris pv. campestris]
MGVGLAIGMDVGWCCRSVSLACTFLGGHAVAFRVRPFRMCFTFTMVIGLGFIVVVLASVRMGVPAGFTAPVRMTSATTYKRVVLRLVELRQFLQECGHVPDIVIAHAFAPSRHATGLDTMLDDPERLGCINGLLGQVRRGRVQAFAQLGLCGAR